MRVILTCQQCGKEYSRPKSESENSRFCSKTCKDESRKTAKWLDMICPECGKSYRIREIYAARVEISCCSLECARKYAGKTGRNGAGQWAKDKDKRLQATAKMANKLKRGIDHPDFKHLPDEQIKLDYENGMSCWEIARKYETSGKTVLKHLRSMGVVIERHGFGKALICEDNHHVQSRPEQQIDNWLFYHQLEHKVHPRLPFGGYADFLVGDIYIEYWGMQHSLRYETRKAFKLSQYSLHNLRLISIMPHDIEHKTLDDILKVLIG